MIKFFAVGTDGGPESGVTGYWLVEWKSLFSIALLHFKKGTRENYHSHAFNALSWFLWGSVEEQHLDKLPMRWASSWWPKLTPKSTFHRVDALEDTWVLTFRGPWENKWQEYSPSTRAYTTLTHGRQVV